MNNNVKIAAGINVYNDKHSLERTLQTTTEYFDRLYIIDGRYPDYSNNTSEKFSTDGTKELVKSYKNCKYIPMFAEQKEKRTRYLKECEYDLLMVIDADEYLKVTSWTHFQDCLQRMILNAPEKYRAHQYQIAYESEPNKIIHLPRLLHKPNQLMYTSHWFLITDPVDNNPMQSSVVIEGLSICTDDLLRPETRLQRDIDYQWLLFKKEGVISDKVFNDTECKANFAKHIIWEVNVWKNHKQEEESKIKYISRYKKKT